MPIESPFSGPIVDAAWLVEHKDSVAVADVRWSIPDGPKYDDYLVQHIPGAVFVDLDVDLSDPPGSRGRHPLPPVSEFRTALSRLGLADQPVVCYDDRSGATAARMWWMLTALGLPAAVLDGGIDSWPGPWESGVAAKPNASARSDHGTDGDLEWPMEGHVFVNDVLSAVDQGLPLLDARSHERFLGTPNPIDPTPGHIPGASSRPWTDNVGPDGRLLPPDDLRASFAALGVDESTPWIASCGSGVTACHNILAATTAGLPRGILYSGSWSEWIQDPARPVATGDSE